MRRRSGADGAQREGGATGTCPPDCGVVSGSSAGADCPPTEAGKAVGW